MNNTPAINNNFGMACVSVQNDEITINGQLMGVTLRLYNETVDKGLEYKEMLIQAGIIEREKTPEELAKEQAAALKTATEALNASLKKQEELMKRIEQYEGGSNEHDEKGRTAGRNGAKGHSVNDAAGDGADAGKGPSGK